MNRLLIKLLLLALMNIVFAQTNGQVYTQDVSGVYTMNNGLGDNFVQRIYIDDNQKPVAVTSKGSFCFNNNRWQLLSKTVPEEKNYDDLRLPPRAGEIITVVNSGKLTAAGCENGLYLRDKPDAEWRRALPANEKYSWALRNVKALAFDTKDRLWFGANEGAGCLVNGKWRLFTGREGLPYNKFTCAAAGTDGIVWFGTEIGAIRHENGKFHYRNGRRWLPDNYINDISVQKDGTAWFATKKGAGSISPLPMTLGKKAEHFTKQVEDRHVRDGFIACCRLEKHYDTSTAKSDISDNDGLYTAMYGAAQAFRYAVTGDPNAKELAKRSFLACKRLVDITHETGFPARVIIPIDWPVDVNKIYDRKYNANVKKQDPFWKDIFPRFVKSKDGKYFWKCDTSSDELAGHYFFYAVYYDLVADTENEKKQVREVVSAITDHLIRNGFYLRDWDGKSTRWGNFSPDYFDSVWGWDQRGLNAMMMLSFLNVAGHITGDEKYAETAQMLRDKYKYHIYAMQSKMYWPPNCVVEWDNNLCLMSMYGLMKYEKNPELLLMYRIGLEHAWLHVSKEQKPLWNTLYGAMDNQFDEIEKKGAYRADNIFTQFPGYAETAINEFSASEPPVNDITEVLQKMPLDFINYQIDNTHRLDILLDTTPGQRENIGWLRDGKALPADERWFGGFQLKRGGSGDYEDPGTEFLLPYYMAVYHGILPTD